MQTSEQPEIVGRAAETAEKIGAATHRAAFKSAVADFRHLMRSVIDYPPGEITIGDVAVLTDIAERAIDAIEDRLDSADDPADTQLELAKTVYSISHALERIDHWHRHYAGA